MVLGFPEGGPMRGEWSIMGKRHLIPTGMFLRKEIWARQEDPEAEA